MQIPVDQIMPVFFAAMRNGYASAGVAKTTDPNCPGMKIIEYLHPESDFRVADAYTVNGLGDWSFGTTTVYWRSQALWMMQYWGHYPKHLIPMLKRALLPAYEQSEFHGGRGIGRHREEVDGKWYCYYNGSRTDNQNWNRFQGIETIRCDQPDADSYGDVEGWHEYMGGILIP